MRSVRREHNARGHERGPDDHGRGDFSGSSVRGSSATSRAPERPISGGGALVLEAATPVRTSTVTAEPATSRLAGGRRILISATLRPARVAAVDARERGHVDRRPSSGVDRVDGGLIAADIRLLVVDARLHAPGARVGDPPAVRRPRRRPGCTTRGHPVDGAVRIGDHGDARGRRDRQFRAVRRPRRLEVSRQ